MTTTLTAFVWTWKLVFIHQMVHCLRWKYWSLQGSDFCIWQCTTAPTGKQAEDCPSPRQTRCMVNARSWPASNVVGTMIYGPPLEFSSKSVSTKTWPHQVTPPQVRNGKDGGRCFKVTSNTRGQEASKTSVIPRRFTYILMCIPNPLPAFPATASPEASRS